MDTLLKECCVTGEQYMYNVLVHDLIVCGGLVSVVSTEQFLWKNGMHCAQLMTLGVGGYITAYLAPYLLPPLLSNTGSPILLPLLT